MGVESSKQPECFKIVKYSNCRMQILNWIEAEENFTLSLPAVVTYLNCSEDVAQPIMDEINDNKHKSTYVNAVTLFVAIIAAAKEETSHLSLIYDLFDTNGKEVLSSEELIVMVMTIGTAFASLVGKGERPSLEKASEFVDQLYRAEGKNKPRRHANKGYTKSELIKWVDQNLKVDGTINVDSFLKVINDVKPVEK